MKSKLWIGFGITVNSVVISGFGTSRHEVRDKTLHIKEKHGITRWKEFPMDQDLADNLHVWLVAMNVDNATSTVAAIGAEIEQLMLGLETRVLDAGAKSVIY